MAANQQLKDYIVQQIKLGVSKETVKSALVSAGWKEEDVNQAFAENESGAVSAPASNPSQPAATAPSSAQGVGQSSAAQGTGQYPAAPASGPAQPAEVAAPAAVSAAAVSSPASVSPVSFVTSDIFKPKGEQVFQPTAVKKDDVQESKPQTALADQKEKPAVKGDKILIISLGVLSLLLLGGNVYFFSQNRNLSPQASAPKIAAALSALEAQVASLTTEKENLTSQIDSLNKTITDLGNQISIFVMPASSSTTPVPFTVSGVLGGGGKVPYSLTTSKNVLLTVKNYKEADIEAAFKNSLGTQVELGGTHQPGSSQLTVTTINGKSLKDAASTPAPAAATPTAPSSSAPAAATASSSTKAQTPAAPTAPAAASPAPSATSAALTAPVPAAAPAAAPAATTSAPVAPAATGASATTTPAP